MIGQRPRTTCCVWTVLVVSSIANKLVNAHQKWKRFCCFYFILFCIIQTNKRKVKTLFDEIRSTLAECVFSLACQQPFSQSDTLLVVNFLKLHCQPLTQADAAAGQKPGVTSIDSIYLYLIMSLLYCFDCSYLENRQSGRRTIIVAKQKRSFYIDKIFLYLNFGDLSLSTTKWMWRKQRRTWLKSTCKRFTAS